MNLKKIFYRALIIATPITGAALLGYGLLYTVLPVRLGLLYLNTTQPIEVNAKNISGYLLSPTGIKIQDIRVKHNLASFNIKNIDVKFNEFGYVLSQNKIKYDVNFDIPNIEVISNNQELSLSESLRPIKGNITHKSYKIFYDNQPVLWGDKIDHTNFKNILSLDISLSNNKVKVLDFIPAFNRFKILARLEKNQINWDIRARTENSNDDILITGHTVLSHYIPTDTELKLASQKPLLLVANSAASIYAVPHLALKLNSKNFTITGNVDIDHGLIHPPKYSSVKASKDIEFVTASGLPEKPETEETKSKFAHFFNDLNIDVSIKILAGTNKLAFTSKDLNAKLSGELVINYADNHKIENPVPTALGEIRLAKTTFMLYGHPLEINQGLLLYTNSELDNPSLKITGVRKVKITKPRNNKKNTDLLDDEPLIASSQPLEGETVTMTLNISNTLNNPDILITSSKSMSESDKISYLLFGLPSHRIGEAQGQIIMQTAKELFGDDNSKYASITKQLKTTLNIDELSIDTQTIINPATGRSTTEPVIIIGKKLFDKLKLKYGFSANNAVSVISGEYEIRKNLSINAQYDANNGSGADIVYSKESDKLL